MSQAIRLLKNLHEVRKEVEAAKRILKKLEEKEEAAEKEAARFCPWEKWIDMGNGLIAYCEHPDNECRITIEELHEATNEPTN